MREDRETDNEEQRIYDEVEISHDSSCFMLVCMDSAVLSERLLYGCRLWTDGTDTGVCQAPHLVDGLC